MDLTKLRGSNYQNNNGFNNIIMCLIKKLRGIRRLNALNYQEEFPFCRVTLLFAVFDLFEPKNTKKARKKRKLETRDATTLKPNC